MKTWSMNECSSIFFSLTPCSIPLHIKQKIEELILYDIKL